MGWAARAALAIFALPAAAQVGVETLPGVDVRAAALLLSAQQGGALAGAVVAGPVKAGEGGKCRLDAWVELHGTPLLGQRRTGTMELQVTLYALGQGGRVSAFDATLVRLPLEALEERQLRQGLRVHRPLGVPCAPQVLRALVRRGDTGEFFLGEASSGVAGETWFAQLLSTEGEWVDVVGAGAPPPPAARPRLRPDNPLRLRLYPPAEYEVFPIVRGRLGFGLATPMQVVAEGGPHDAWLVAEWLPPPTSPGGREELLEVIVVTPSGEETVARLPVWVVDEATPSPALMGSTAEDRAALAAAELRGAYLEVLRQLAGGGEEQALGALKELQRRALAAGGAAPAARFASMVRAVAAEVMTETQAGLPALLWLHLELVHWSRGTAESLGAGVAGDVVLELGRWCGSWCAEAVRLAAAQALAAVGQVQARQASWQSARRLFEQALRLAPALEEARLGLAAVAEWLGEYREAVRVLSGGEDSPGASGELLLRLAVNLQRVGESRRARAVLERTIHSGAEEWVRVVALEELAQLELADRQPLAAIHRLRGAVAAFSEQPSLRLLLAQALEESGDLVAAQAILNELATTKGDPGESPRLRYARWSEESTRALRQRVHAAAREALPWLAAALEVRR